ncbi:MAG: hypothetical protein K2N17_05905 [Clostridia bacterium]|nr:hypothetical protein [Clostridia bacterium]
MHFTENFALFNLLKLLGGMTSAQNGTNFAQSAENEFTAPQFNAPTDGTAANRNAPPPAEKHNVMADVIERHERIINRMKSGR